LWKKTIEKSSHNWTIQLEIIFMPTYRATKHKQVEQAKEI